MISKKKKVFAEIKNLSGFSGQKQVISKKKKKGRGYFASGGKITPCYFAIWRQNSPNGYFAARAKSALSLILTQILTQILPLSQTLTLILTLIPTLALTLTQNSYPNTGKTLFCRKIATSKKKVFAEIRRLFLAEIENLSGFSSQKQ